MRHSSALFFLGFGAPAAAWFKFPPINSSPDESWTPPRETSLAEHEVHIAQGWSPRPTDAPKPLFGRMQLLARDDEYVLAPGTCGYIPSNECKFCGSF